MLFLVFHQVVHQLACAVKLCLYGTQRGLKLNSDFFVGKLMKVAKAYKLLVLRRKHSNKYLDQLFFLRFDRLLLRIGIKVLDIERHRLPVIIRVSILNAQRIDLFLANKVNGIVGRNTEKPGAESKILFEPVEGF